MIFRKLLSAQPPRILILNGTTRYLHYIQGQSPEPNVREYFYFIDHQGMVNFGISISNMFDLNWIYDYSIAISGWCKNEKFYFMLQGATFFEVLF